MAVVFSRASSAALTPYCTMHCIITVGYIPVLSGLF